MTHDLLGPTFYSDRVCFDCHNSCENNYNKLFKSQKTLGDLEFEGAMSSSYPGLEGPLVGQKISSHAITEEYAKADPVYVQKTAALPKIYSHYRPILGDGNCGWRAIGFAYFEIFIRLRSKARLEEEMARISSLNNLLMTAGRFEQWLFEDMAEETISLLRDLAQRVEVNLPEAECILMERFNNADVSNSIIYHFRLLVSSWLKANSSMYEGFILDGTGVDEYSKNYIEPVNVEIEHLIMCVLIDVLLKPIGIAVEIVYLDLTPGSQANVHVFQEENPVGVPQNSGPIIHLLFRPSHYDILYRDELISTFPPTITPRSMTIQANRAFIEQHIVQSAPVNVIDDDFLLGRVPISNLSEPSKTSKTFYIGNSAPFVNPLEQPCLSPVSPCTSPTQSVSSSTFSSSHPTSGPYIGSSSIDANTSTIQQFAIHSDLSPLQRPHYYTLPSTLPPPPNSSSSFRPSKYEWAAVSDWQESQLTVQSPTFKNSHYNTAHFNNANFQPEQWTPDSDDTQHSRKKSSG